MDFRRQFFYAADYVDFACEVHNDEDNPAPLKEALSELLVLVTEELERLDRTQNNNEMSDSVTYTKPQGNVYRLRR